MRKLAPMIVLTSLFAFSGATFAASTTDKVGNPTVTPNTTNPQGLSYSDKSNTSTGTNAAMDDKTKATAAMEEDKKMDKKKMKKAKADAKIDTNVQSGMTMGSTSTHSGAATHSGTMNSGTSTTGSGAAPVAPAPGTTTGGTNAAAVNSTTGKSGQ